MKKDGNILESLQCPAWLIFITQYFHEGLYKVDIIHYLEISCILDILTHKIAWF